MPRWTPGRVPLLRHHKPTGCAVVTLNGRDYWCGKYGTPEAAATYNSIIGRWLAGDRQPMEPATAPTADPIRLKVSDLVLAHQRPADAYYRDADGKPTPEAVNVKLQLRVLLDHTPGVAVDNFGPKALKDVREKSVRSANRRGGVMGWVS